MRVALLVLVIAGCGGAQLTPRQQETVDRNRALVLDVAPDEMACQPTLTMVRQDGVEPGMQWDATCGAETVRYVCGACGPQPCVTRELAGQLDCASYPRG